MNKEISYTSSLDVIAEMLGSIKYGKVTLEIQDGKIFRIVKEESIKL